MSAPTALITGGGTGIGRATALELGARGWKVAVAGRRPEPLAEAVASLGKNGLSVPGDVRVEEQAGEMVARTVEAFGSLDLLVNNAGIYVPARVADSTEDAWRESFEVNLHAPWRLCRLAYPHLVRSGRGAVVNVLSTLAHQASASVSAYCASKAALGMLTRCLALEWAPDRIRVNSVSPGIVDTPIHTPGAVDRLADAQPLGRVGSPEEIAHAIVFLASGESAWTTGANLDVDGGISAA